MGAWGGSHGRGLGSRRIELQACRVPVFIPLLSSLAQLNPVLVTKSSLFGFGIAFSPLHIAVVALLLLGPTPVRRALAYVAGWSLANALAIVLLMVLGEVFSINLSHGEREQVLVDLLGAGALIGLGLYELTPRASLAEEGMALKLMPCTTWQRMTSETVSMRSRCCAGA